MLFRSVSQSRYTYIVSRSAVCLNQPLTVDGALEIAQRSRGTPRIANRLLRRVRDFAQVKANGEITKEVAQQALTLLAVDQQGFDYLDCKLLLALIEKFAGGPVGVETLAAAIGEERETIEDVLEPYLIQQGFLQRTPRGQGQDAEGWLDGRRQANRYGAGARRKDGGRSASGARECERHYKRI